MYKSLIMKYDKFSYIYPPRPKNAVSPSDINKWDNGMLLAQPKLNGSNCVIFINESEIFIMNRHNQRLTNFQINLDEVRQLYRGEGWMVLNGEYLNKSKLDENKQVFNHKLVIFDILVYNNDYLVGKTFQNRVDLLTKLYDEVDCSKDYLFKITDNVYRVKTYYNSFNEIFQTLSQIDVIEGLVCKRISAKLEIGNTESNNIKSQIKFRKATKNYKF